jgi:hypothetical protein
VDQGGRPKQQIRARKGTYLLWRLDHPAPVDAYPLLALLLTSTTHVPDHAQPLARVRQQSREGSHPSRRGWSPRRCAYAPHLVRRCRKGGQCCGREEAVGGAEQ